MDDKKGADGDDEGRVLPPLKEGEQVALHDLDAEQHFTEPPPRYSEASLVKTLEEYGIGRPSTYAAIISTLQAREYAVIEARRFLPTDVGRVVNRFLTQHFARYVDYDFTAKLEDELDDVSRGEKEWVPLMHAFWGPFNELLQDKEESVSRSEAAQVRELGIDPKSGKPVSVRIGRFGPFVQIGTKDDADKPRFASLRPDQRMDTIEFEAALELFQLPRDLGKTADEELIKANVGRFGPYVQYGKKYVSLKEDDPYSITRERALELIAVHKEAEANKYIRVFDGSPVAVLNGRYGPYITDGKKNAKIPKDRVPAELNLEDCLSLLAAAPDKKAGPPRRGKPPAKAKAS